MVHRTAIPQRVITTTIPNTAKTGRELFDALASGPFHMDDAAKSAKHLLTVLEQKQPTADSNKAESLFQAQAAPSELDRSTTTIIELPAILTRSGHSSDNSSIPNHFAHVKDSLHRYETMGTTTPSETVPIITILQEDQPETSSLD
jgi:hypothetical protein